jgi:hypothetical protein
VRIEKVQRFVGSALALTIASILAGGLCFLAAVADGTGARPGLLIISGAIGVVTMMGVRVLNQLPVLTLWLVLGMLPAALGWYWLYLR